MNCPTCRRPLREDLAQCPQCGADLSCWVTGADGRPCGPYPLSEVRRYVAEGRIVPNAQVSQGGGPWMPVGLALGPAPGPARAKGGISPVAIVLLVIGGVALLGIIAVAALVGAAGTAARGQASAARCRSNLKQVALGVMMFSQDHNETFPDATTWETDVQPYVRDTGLFTCPSGGGEDQSYEMNPALSRANLMQVPNLATTPLVYDAGFSNGTPPHPEGWMVAFADGHCKAVTASEAAQYGSP